MARKKDDNSRSEAARRGWETRRQREKEIKARLSEISRRGWETRRKNAEAAKRNKKQAAPRKEKPIKRPAPKREKKPKGQGKPKPKKSAGRVTAAKTLNKLSKTIKRERSKRSSKSSRKQTRKQKVKVAPSGDRVNLNPKLDEVGIYKGIPYFPDPQTAEALANLQASGAEARHPYQTRQEAANKYRSIGGAAYFVIVRETDSAGRPIFVPYFIKELWLKSDSHSAAQKSAHDRARAAKSGGGKSGKSKGSGSKYRQ